MEAAGKPVWTTASYLLYTGGLVVLGAAVAALSYLSGQYGSFAYSLWALLVFAVLHGLAEGNRALGRWMPAGIFGFTAVIAFGAFVGALWTWFGWLSKSFDQFSFGRLLLELLVLIAAGNAAHRFKFPFIVAISVFVGWFFAIDLLTSGGNWTAWVTLFVGFLYFLVGSASDSPAAFWYHLAAGLLIGGSLVYWWHSSTFDWILVAFFSLVYIGVAHGSKRSSWAVLGTLGLLAVTTHFSDKWSGNHVSPSPEAVSALHGWVPPLVFAVFGFALVGIGVAFSRSRDGRPTAT
ncbi:MAG TPA: hypothetical protein VMJ49_08705 [Gaiellaceae bacterium]|nr:hypothetical protein [Gaiellaceae bacterium]